MTDTPEPTRPRPRRKPGAGDHATTPASQSTRVLLRLPHLTVTGELSAAAVSVTTVAAAKTTPPSAQSSVAPPVKVAAPLTTDKLATPVVEKPVLEKPTVAALPPVAAPVHRIDAAHAAVPAPHSAAPAWLETKTSVWTTLTQRKTLTAAGLILAVIIGGSMLRGKKTPLDDKSNLTDAPKFSAVKKEPKSSSRKPSDDASTADKSKPKTAETSSDKAGRAASLPGEDFSAHPRRDSAGGPLFPEPRANQNTSASDIGAANRPGNLGSPPPRTPDIDYRPVAREPTATITSIDSSRAAPTPSANTPPPGTVEYPVTPFDPIPAMPAFNPSRGSSDGSSSDVNWARTNPGVRTALREPAAGVPSGTPNGTPRSELPGVARFEGSIGKPPANVPSNTYPR